MFSNIIVISNNERHLCYSITHEVVDMAGVYRLNIPFSPARGLPLVVPVIVARSLSEEALNLVNAENAKGVISTFADRPDEVSFVENYFLRRERTSDVYDKRHETAPLVCRVRSMWDISASSYWRKLSVDYFHLDIMQGEIEADILIDSTLWAILNILMEHIDASRQTVLNDRPLKRVKIIVLSDEHSKHIYHMLDSYFTLLTTIISNLGMPREAFDLLREILDVNVILHSTERILEKEELRAEVRERRRQKRVPCEPDFRAPSIHVPRYIWHVPVQITQCGYPLLEYFKVKLMRTSMHKRSLIMEIMGENFCETELLVIAVFSRETMLVERTLSEVFPLLRVYNETMCRRDRCNKSALVVFSHPKEGGPSIDEKIHPYYDVIESIIRDEGALTLLEYRSYVYQEAKDLAIASYYTLSSTRMGYEEVLGGVQATFCTKVFPSIGELRALLDRIARGGGSDQELRAAQN